MRHVLRGQEGGLELEVPAILESTFALCRRVGVPFENFGMGTLVHISEYACGRCRGCNKHRDTMRELGYGEY